MTAKKERLRLRFLRDPLSIRLGELAVTFARVSSSAFDKAMFARKNLLDAPNLA